MYRNKVAFERYVLLYKCKIMNNDHLTVLWPACNLSIACINALAQIIFEMTNG